jgi:phospholipase/carboxylesterase
MREEQFGGLHTRVTGGTDGKGGGTGPVVILLHGFGAPGDDLVSLADVLNVPTGTRFVFPEGPLSLSFGPSDARAWWLIDMARIAADQAAGRARDLSQDIPKGLAPAREKMLVFLKEIEQQFGGDPRKTVLGGFSQGAMLSCDDVAERRSPMPDWSNCPERSLPHRNGFRCSRNAKGCRSFKVMERRTSSCRMSERSAFATH